MKINTNMPAEFAAELKLLLDKYGIVGANGWDDGSLLLYPADGAKPAKDGPFFWVEFNDDDAS